MKQNLIISPKNKKDTIVYKKTAKSNHFITPVFWKRTLKSEYILWNWFVYLSFYNYPLHSDYYTLSVDFCLLNSVRASDSL
jgi:hypothetical protein